MMDLNIISADGGFQNTTSAASSAMSSVTTTPMADANGNTVGAVSGLGFGHGQIDELHRPGSARSGHKRSHSKGKSMISKLYFFQTCILEKWHNLHVVALFTALGNVSNS